jgi:hypothetical protein
MYSRTEVVCILNITTTKIFGYILNITNIKKMMLGKTKKKESFAYFWKVDNCPLLSLTSFT